VEGPVGAAVVSRGIRGRMASRKGTLREEEKETLERENKRTHWDYLFVCFVNSRRYISANLVSVGLHPL
jgi:hypothetical protein